MQPPAPAGRSKTDPKRILITRSFNQASDLVSRLQAIGAHPIAIPTISIEPPESYIPLDAAIARLEHFEWLVFTSANAVESFAARASMVGLPRGGRNPKIAAIGAVTARALTSIGRTPDLVPSQATAEALAEALLPYVHPGVTTMLLVRAEQARDTLPDALRAARADLTIAPAYRNLIPHESIPALRSLFRSPATWPHAITFTSSSTAMNLFHLLTAAEVKLPPDEFGKPEIVRVSIGPITSQTLRDLGHPPHLEASEPSIAALVHTLAEALGLR